MGIVEDRTAVPVADSYTEGATFRFPAIEKLDVLPYSADVVVQYDLGANNWQPREGQRFRAGFFKSVPGLSQVFPPGPTGVRFRRAVAGSAATVDFTAYAAE